MTEPEGGADGRRARGYSWSDWQADGFSGPPPWRRGYRPGHLVLSLLVVVLVLAILVWAGSRLA